MMTPDLAMIAEVMLAAEGFREARVLAKKTVTLYSLMIQQLSKQVRMIVIDVLKTNLLLREGGVPYTLCHALTRSINLPAATPVPSTDGGGWFRTFVCKGAVAL